MQFISYVRAFRHFLEKNIFLITAILGSLIVTCWTIYKFTTKPVIFDLVGQQLLTSHWLNGYMDGATVAPTNYILKMLFVYAPFELAGIPPSISIVAMTLMLNISTFLILLVVIKKILVLIGIPVSTFFYVAMLWFATISGSVFWIQFANSRNIEVACGVLFAYLGMKLLLKPSKYLTIAMVVLSSFLFFADPLQLYMTTTSLMMVTIIWIAKKQTTIKRSLMLLATVGVGFAVQLFLVLIAKNIFSIEFFSVSSLQQSLAVLNDPVLVIKELMISNIRLFVGGDSFPAVHKVLNLFLLFGLTLSLFYLAIKRRLTLKMLALPVSAILIVEVVYVLSGQVLSGGDTSRYLIMIAPMLVILISMNTFLQSKLRAISIVVLSCVVVLNIIFLLTAFTQVKSAEFVNQQHLRTTIEYLENQDISYAYSSMDTALPASYLYGSAEHSLLPLSCSDRLAPSNLFYDKAAFRALQARSVKFVAIILDGHAINNHPNTCAAKEITVQLGFPSRVDQTKDGSMVLIYEDVDSISRQFTIR